MSRPELASVWAMTRGLAKSKLPRIAILVVIGGAAGCTVDPAVPAKQAVQHTRKETKEIDSLRKKQLQEVDDEAKGPPADDSDSAEEP